MPILRQEAVLNIAGDLKALMRLEARITRGALPASGEDPARDQERRQARARMGKQARQIKRLRRRLSQAKKGERRGRKKDERLKKLQGQLEKMRAQLAKAQGQLANARGH